MGIVLVVKKSDCFLSEWFGRTIFITGFFVNHPRGCDIHRIMAPGCQSARHTLVVIFYIESFNVLQDCILLLEKVFLPYKVFERVIESIQKGQIQVNILLS